MNYKIIILFSLILTATSYPQQLFIEPELGHHISLDIDEQVNSTQMIGFKLGFLNNGITWHSGFRYWESQVIDDQISSTFRTIDNSENRVFVLGIGQLVDFPNAKSGLKLSCEFVINFYKSNMNYQPMDGSTFIENIYSITGEGNGVSIEGGYYYKLSNNIFMSAGINYLYNRVSLTRPSEIVDFDEITVPPSVSLNDVFFKISVFTILN
jgi:hypothetical protein